MLPPFINWNYVIALIKRHKKIQALPVCTHLCIYRVFLGSIILTIMWINTKPTTRWFWNTCFCTKVDKFIIFDYLGFQLMLNLKTIVSHKKGLFHQILVYEFCSNCVRWIWNMKFYDKYFLLITFLNEKVISNCMRFYFLKKS